MTSWKSRSFARVMYGVVASCLAFAASGSAVQAQDFPKYDHVFLIIMVILRQRIKNGRVRIVDDLMVSLVLRARYEL
jgi:hypothetical protein